MGTVRLAGAAGLVPACVVMAGLLLASCGSDSTATRPTVTTDQTAAAEQSVTTDPAATVEPTVTTEPTVTEESIVTEEPTTTMQKPPDDTGSTLSGEMFVLAEQQHFGQTSQELISVSERLTDGLPVRLTPRDLGEDRQGGTAVVFALPLAEIGDDIDGFYLLSIGTAGSGPIEIRTATWQIGESTAALILEATPGGSLEATWSYSLRPRMRPVFLADEDGSLGVEAMVLHDADFGPGPVSADAEDPSDDLIRSTFTTPLWLIDQTPLAEACERVADELGERGGKNDLQLPLDTMDDRRLEDAASAVEQLLPQGQQVNLVVQAGGTETVRGKRLQPFVRYPVTLFDGAQNPIAGTLGCSISPS